LDSSSPLAAAAAGGDAAATADLLALVWPDAFRIALSILGDRTAAEDVAQEACARALASISSLRKSAAFRAWFYRIVVNESKRRLGTSNALLQEESIRADDGPTPEDRVDLHSALRALDPSLRIAIVLRYYFDLKGADIARIVGASPMTVRWRLFLARRRLRSMLSERITSQQTPMKRTGEYADERQAVR
jgi:RNA polymerase sigma-70 factor (ECF subfamily)